VRIKMEPEEKKENEQKKVIRKIKYKSFTKQPILNNLSRIGIPLTTTDFKNVYGQIEKAFENYKPIKITKTHISTKTGIIQNIEDLEVLNEEKLRFGTEIKFQTTDNTIKGKLFIGHGGDYLPEVQELLKKNIVAPTPKDEDYVRVSGKMAGHLTIATVLGSAVEKLFLPFGFVVLGDQARRAYNTINAYSHYTIEIEPKKILTEQHDLFLYTNLILDLKKI